MLEIKLVDHIEIEEVPKPEIGRLISFEQIKRQRLKEEPAINDVARANIVLVTLHQVRWHRVELNTSSNRFLIAPNFELHAVTFELPLHHFWEFYPLAFQFYVGIARDRMIIDCQQNIARSKHFRARSGGDNSADQNPATVVLQTKKLSLRGILQLQRCDSKIDIPIVTPVADVFEETIDHRRRHHVSDALRDVAAVTLKRHADHLRVLHDRPATVARINLRADLHREVLVD